LQDRFLISTLSSLRMHPSNVLILQDGASNSILGFTPFPQLRVTTKTLGHQG
jgi:hypothetical protein